MRCLSKTIIVKLQLFKKFYFLEAKQGWFELNLATEANGTICGLS